LNPRKNQEANKTLLDNRCGGLVLEASFSLEVFPAIGAPSRPICARAITFCKEMKMKRRIAKFILFGATLLFFWLVFIGVAIWNFGDRDDAKISDCIIVLGAAAYGDKPSPVFEERIKHAIILFQQGDAPVIIFTGGRGVGASHAESEVATSYAVLEGVDRAAIHSEAKSRTTKENLSEAKKLMNAEGFKTAILVSDLLHMKRASMMADDLGMAAVTSPTPTTRYRSIKTKLGFLLREVYFYHHYRITGD
jgi:uncharacterized SAM-binding protein YcdF (DUF218 family)